MMYEFVAEFPKAESAAAFAARIQEPGWWSSDVVLKGRKVSFKVASPEGFEQRPENGPNQIFIDFLGSVGYYGSSASRKAKLNGVAAPMVW